MLLICDPLQGQSIAQGSLTHAHLRGLKLADCSVGDDDVMVNVLVGSDQYWHLVTGRVVQGGGPTAIQTKLGWVLSGPLHGANQTEQQRKNLVATHVLETAVNPVNITNERLNGNMRRLWDQESLGITPRSVYE